MSVVFTDPETVKDPATDVLLRRHRRIGQRIEKLEAERELIYEELGRRAEDDFYFFTLHDLRNFDRPTEVND